MIISVISQYVNTIFLLSLLSYLQNIGKIACKWLAYFSKMLIRLEMSFVFRYIHGLQAPKGAQT